MKKLQLWSLLRFKMLLRGERPCKKKNAAIVWRFPWSLDHFHNLVRFSTERCEDSHIKKPKDISGYLEEGRTLFRKTRRWKNVFFSEEDPKEYLFGINPKESLSLLEGEWRFFSWGRLKGKAYWGKLMLMKLELFDLTWEMLGSFSPFWDALAKELANCTD